MARSRVAPAKEAFSDLALWAEVMGALARCLAANAYLADCRVCLTGSGLGRFVGGQMCVSGRRFFGCIRVSGDTTINFGAVV